MIELYFLTGLLNVFWTAFVRKADAQGDWILVVFVWFLLWPFTVIARVAEYLHDLYVKHKI